ncbi:MAG TPA: non-canonical purine NTP pyrophosphatase, partial [Mycobacterium sp.]|nr:non-canonical purine NTP pyrophosphatase [Mycobacterium sp.]
EGLQVTAAELSAGEKDALSHRGRALRRLVPALRRLAA